MKSCFFCNKEYKDLTSIALTGIFSPLSLAFRAVGLVCDASLQTCLEEPQGVFPSGQGFAQSEFKFNTQKGTKQQNNEN